MTFISPRTLVLVFLNLWLAVGGAVQPASAQSGQSLASARLQISGSRLAVSPVSQTVPFDVPTIVETSLEGYDPALGVLPTSLRVLADFSGPEVDGTMVLETVPNEPFRIPRLRLEGEYRLENIRLAQDGEILAYFVNCLASKIDFVALPPKNILTPSQEFPSSSFALAPSNPISATP